MKAKERDSITKKAYYQANKERILEARRIYRANNQDKIKAKAKEYRDANSKILYKKRVLDYFVVYGLMDGYVGMTNSPYHRMSQHKYKGKDTEDWFILGVCPTEKDARLLERQYHDKGYSGRYKRQIK